VHGWISEEKVEKRMNAINAFEDLLAFDNNTVILKFFLHLSKDQQKLELEERLNEPDKYWKHNAGDWEQREHWDEYMRCYEDVLNWSKTPWTVVPVDDRWYRDYVVSKAIVEALEALNMSYPEMEE
jgi:polyphosphate kinase 2 (PPK2 family)